MKMDILTNSAIVKTNNAVFNEQGIIKAKLCQNGFITLTKKSNIYYVPDIKVQKPYFFVNIKDQFNLSNDFNFLGISSTTSDSGKVELLILKENGKGFTHIKGCSEEAGKMEKNKNVNAKNTFNNINLYQKEINIY